MSIHTMAVTQEIVEERTAMTAIYSAIYPARRMAPSAIWRRTRPTITRRSATCHSRTSLSRKSLRRWPKRIRCGSERS